MELATLALVIECLVLCVLCVLPSNCTLPPRLVWAELVTRATATPLYIRFRSRPPLCTQLYCTKHASQYILPVNHPQCESCINRRPIRFPAVRRRISSSFRPRLENLCLLRFQPQRNQPNPHSFHDCQFAELHSFMGCIQCKRNPSTLQLEVEVVLLCWWSAPRNTTWRNRF